MGHDRPKRAAPGPTTDTGKRWAKCGYNLTGLTEPRCPECGWRIEKESAGESSPLADFVFVLCFFTIVAGTGLISVLLWPDHCARRGGFGFVGTPSNLDMAAFGFAFFQMPAGFIAMALGVEAKLHPRLRSVGGRVMLACVLWSGLFLLYRFLA